MHSYLNLILVNIIQLQELKKLEVNNNLKEQVFKLS